MSHKDPDKWYGTTILAVRHNNELVIGCDGQVTLGAGVVKSTANKLRRLGKDNDILAGFAGSTADAFALFTRLEEKIESYPKQLARAAVEMAKDWRTDKYLRKLEAMMIVGDAETLLIVTGLGDVLEPENDIAAIGSGGNYALSSARALLSEKVKTSLSSEEIVKMSLSIAADICIYTNHNIRIEKL